MATEGLTDRTLVMILCGGRGERLHPLTRDRAKPSVPFLGAYRMIDFSLSNCLNSGLRRIALLTQYKSLSLERHILFGWNIFPAESRGFVISLPAQGRVGERWYEGTADAVFQNVYTIQEESPEAVLVLSGDHIYSCDYRRILAYAEAKDAGAVILVKPVPRAEGRRFGIIAVDGENRVAEFLEKPKSPPGLPGDESRALASMGIYLFRTPILIRALFQDAKNSRSSHDFGRDVLPRLIRDRKVFAFFHEGYWEDIGTVEAYWAAHMSFLSGTPPFDLHDPAWPVRTYQSQQPPALLDRVEAASSMIGRGCRVRGSILRRSILASGVEVEEGSRLVESIVLDGARLGRGVRLRRAIIDKNAVLPDGFAVGHDEAADRRLFKRFGQGITVVPRNWRAA